MGNLLWLRAEAQRTGTDALDDLGCGARGTGQVLYSDCDWGALPAGVVFDIHDDVTTAAMIANADRMPFSDENSSGDPMRYTTAENYAAYVRGTIPAGAVFDIHDNLTSATIADADRLAFSDEGSAGDPMRFSTAANLADYMQVEVELSANRVTSDTFNTARIPTLTLSKITDSGTAASRNVGTSSGNVPVLDAGGHIENDRLSGIPRTALSFASGTASVPTTGSTTTNNVVFTTPAYAFRPTPYWERTGDTAAHFRFEYRGVELPTSDDREHRWRIISTGSANTRSGIGTAPWLYLSTSDRPSVWVRQARVSTYDDETETWTETDALVPGVWNIWIAEDPLVDGDTRSPLSGAGAVNIGLPSDTILSTLMATLPTALAAWRANLITRKWAVAPPASYAGTIALVSERYAPAARLWAMRAIAEADGIGEADAYLTLLQVGPNDTWELATS